MSFVNRTGPARPWAWYVSSIVKSILFADDTNLFLVGDDLKEVCETMSFELDKLSRWFQANKLSLNVSTL